MILPIKNYKKKSDQKILRTKAVELRMPLSAEVKKLIADMAETLINSGGIGLAAPQVGKSARILLVNLEHLGVPMFALVNPVITKFSAAKSEMEEGCLSIPGVFGMVERPEKINFKALLPNGQEIKTDADGLLGRVIQHEVDHLDGILIIDKISRYTKGKKAVT